jgi:hypothetical protein
MFGVNALGNKMKAAVVVASLLAAVGLGPVAVFADDGALADYTPDGYTADLNARPTADLSAGQMALESINTPLDQLVASCMPGVSSVSVQLVPEENPTFLLVNAVNADGSEAVTQKLDASFLRSCAAMASSEGDRGATAQATRVAIDEQSILRDYQ